MNFMDKAAVGQPQQGKLIFLRPRALSDEHVNELFIFFSELRRNAVPEHPDPRHNFFRGALGKILLVGVEDALLNFTHRVEILVLGKVINCFRHPAHITIMSEQINILLFKCAYQLEITFS